MLPSWFRNIALCAGAVGLAAISIACGGRAGIGPRPAEPASAPAGGAVVESPLTGRIVTVSLSEDGTANVVRAIDPVTGDAEELWRIEGGATVSEWRISPDGRVAAYRRAAYDGTSRDALVIQPLAAGAAPATVTTMVAPQARLAGFAWSPSSEALAFGREVGPLFESGISATAGLEWELHVVAADEATVHRPAVAPLEGNPMADRVVWRTGGRLLEAQLLALVGWHPAARRAALLEVPRDGGPVVAVQVVDTTSAEPVGRFPAGAVVADTAASPDGRWLALLTGQAEPRQVRVLELATGEVTDVATPAAGREPRAPVWSPDGRWLAWTEQVLPATVDEPGQVEIRAVPLADAAGGTGRQPDLRLTLDVGGATAVAFSTAGDALLVATAAPLTEGPTGLAVYELAGGRSTELGWALPAGTWSIGWVPDGDEG